MTATPDHKRAYHHGGLKEALIDAAHQLITEKGVDNFTMTDASRMAGVSAAAPYRHFADRQALIDALATRGYIALAERTRAERDRLGIGTVPSMIAMGQAYVRFAVEEPELYRLMVGRHVENKFMIEPDPEGRKCYEVLLEAVQAYLDANPGIGLSLWEVAIPLWSLVHGTASLLIDRNFEVMAPETDPDRVIEATTIAFFAGLAQA